MAEIFRPGAAPSALPAPGYQNQDFSRSSFGGALADGFASVGDAVGQIGAQIDHQRKIQQAQDNQTAVTAAMNDFQQHVRNVQFGDPNDPESVGFLTRQGKDAVDHWQPTLQGIDETRGNIAANLTPEQQEEFNQRSQSFQNAAFNGMAGHVAQQRMDYQNDVFKSSLDNYANSGAANIDDPQVFGAALNSGRTAILRRLQTSGVPADSPIAQRQLQDWNDQYLSTAAKAAADSDNAIKAQDLLDANRGNMSAPAYEQTSQQLRAHVWKQQGHIGYQSVSGDPEAQPTPIPPSTSPDNTFAAMIHLESGGRQTGSDGNALTSSKGAIGRAQMLPDTARETAKAVGLPWDEARFRTDGAYNQALGQAYFERLCQQYGGNQTLACAAYNAGPGNVDKWVKQFGDPRTGAISDKDFVSMIPFDETRKYVSRTGASQTAPNDPPAHTAPDWSARATAISQLPIPDEAKEYAFSELNRDKSVWEATTATQRSQLQDSVQDLGSAFAHGNTTNDIPETQIRQLYEPAEADRAISQLQALRSGADQANAMRYAPPDQVAATQARDLDAERNGEDVSDYTKRVQIASMRNAIITQRQQQMKDDPVAYADGAPVMQQARADLQQAEQSGDANQIAQAQQAYIRQSTALQRYLSPNQTPRVLSKDQAAAITSRFTNLDPAKDDPRALLDAVKQHYGDAYPQVMGDLVRSGLPEPYMLMDNLSRPASEIFSSALRQGGGKSDAALKVLRESVGQDVRTQIEPPATQGVSALETQLAPLMATFRAQGAPDMVNSVLQAAKLQAYAYAARNVADPVGQAAKDFLGKYDISGAIRAPKGTMSAVLPALQQLQADPSRLDVAPLPSSNPALNDHDRANETASRIRNQGVWVTNSDETGYVLTLPSTLPGHSQIVRDRSGKPVTVPLRSILNGTFVNPYDDQQIKQGKNAKAAFEQDSNQFDWSGN